MVRDAYHLAIVIDPRVWIPGVLTIVLTHRVVVDSLAQVKPRVPMTWPDERERLLLICREYHAVRTAKKMLLAAISFFAKRE